MAKRKKQIERICRHLLLDCSLGYIPSYEERELMKQFYGLTMKKYAEGNASLEELVSAAMARLLAWFFRSAERCPKAHPSFEIFVAMLLNEEQVRSTFPAELAEMLVDKYGRRDDKWDGRIDGSYWVT